MITPDAIKSADASGRLLLSKYNGRLVVMLPRIAEAQQTEWVKRVVDALDAAGLSPIIDPEVKL